MKQIKGLDSLMQKLSSLGGNLQGALKRAVQQTTQAAEKEANIRKPYSSISIQSEVKETVGKIEGRVFALPLWDMYVELGTGPKGQADHGGISPNISVTYTQHPWAYQTEDGSWVTTSGQPAKPHLYPAAKLAEPIFEQAAANEIRKEIRRVSNG